MINGIPIANIAEVNGISVASIDSINGVTLTASPYEDLSTFTEVDSAGDLTVATYRVDYDTMRRDASAYLYKDYGAGNFTDFEIQFEMEITAAGNQANNMIAGVSNTVGTLSDHDSAGDGLVIVGYNSGASALGLYLIDYPTLNNDSYITASASISLLYCTLTRSGTTATLDLYSDASRTTLVDSLSVTCATTAYRYLYAVASLGSGVSGSITITGHNKNFEII